MAPTRTREQFTERRPEERHVVGDVYPRTFELKASVHFRGGGLRPLVEVEPTDHPLAVEQQRGITMERVQEIVAALMHRH